MEVKGSKTYPTQGFRTVLLSVSSIFFFLDHFFFFFGFLSFLVISKTVNKIQIKSYTPFEK